MVDAGGRLREMLTAHSQLHQRLHGTRHIVPKNHWAFDVCEQLEQDDFLFDAFIIERLHLRVRAVAENCKNIQDYEVSVLSGITNDHARRASEAVYAQGAMGRSHPFPGLPGAFVSDSLELAGARMSVGDFVARGDGLGSVVACALDEGELYVVVDVWKREEKLTLHSARWVGAGAREVWKASETTECLAWQIVGEARAVVIAM